MNQPSISVIIPCWKDCDAARDRVQALQETFAECEFVIADATPDNDGWELPGATVVRCKEPGRGGQLNAGARESSGDILIFNHADTLLTKGHLEAVRSIAADVIGGGFYKAFRKHHPRMAFLEPLVRAYTSRWGILYGDHSIFVRRGVFEELDGFAEIKLMEDVDFSDRLRKRGRVVLADPPIETSMRRFQARGYLKNRLQNLLFVWLWRSKLVDGDTLHRWYYKRA